MPQCVVIKTTFYNYVVTEKIDPILLTVEQVALQLSVSSKTVSRLINNNEFQFVRIGRSIRIPKEELFNYVERNKRYNYGCVESVQSSKGENACDSINVTAFTTLPTNQEVENRLDALLKPKANK